MVVNMRSRTSLFVAGLPRWLSKKSKVAMLINDTDIKMVMIHEQYIKEEKLRDREEFKYKRAKT